MKSKSYYSSCVSIEIAYALREHNFHGPCRNAFHKTKGTEFYYCSDHKNPKDFNSEPYTTLGGNWCSAPTYAEVFDWLMEKGWFAAIGRKYDFVNVLVTERFEWGLEKVGCFSSQPEDGSGFCDSWHEAANAAIEKALTLI